MKQKEITSIVSAINSATTASNGIAKIGEAVGIKHSLAEAVNLRRTELIDAGTDKETAKKELRTRRTALRVALKAAIIHATSARDLLKKTHGTTYNQSWDEAGFVGKIRIPTSVPKLETLLETLVKYLTKYPERQSADMEVTIVQTQKVLDTLKNAFTAVTEQKTTARTATRTRQTKFKALKRQLGKLTRELRDLLEPLDERWLTFGLNMPGADEPPDMPQNVTAVLIGHNAIAVKWDPAPRATTYRVLKRVIGVDEQFVEVGTPKDVDFTIENLPANSAVEVSIVAYNNGGDSDMSNKVFVETTAPVVGH